MITPRFHLAQDEKTFTLTIRAPYCSLKELDVQIDRETFLFYCKPYYLRLKLPGKIHEEHGAHSEFDADAGEFTFTYAKVHRGETFENLNFITQFLSPKLEVHEDEVSSSGRKIEVLSSAAPEEDPVEAEHQYGFAQRGGYKFNFVSAEFHDIFALNPHEVPLSERKALRLQSEADAFNVDHYLADYIDSDEIESLMHQTSPWRKRFKEKAPTEPSQTFTASELDFLKDLPNIQYEISPKQERYAFCSLLDILFAYCYDRRTSCFEGSCESGWNILKLSASMHWFDAFDTPRDVIVACYRRALIYPLYRSFDLCRKVLEDVKDVLKLGESEIIKVLIEIYGVFLGGDSARYILNHLFVKDYVIFAQKWDKTKWKAVQDEISDLEVTKGDLGLDLDEIEQMTNESEAEEEESDEDASSEEGLDERLKKMSINAKRLDSDDSESEDSDDSCSESDSEE